MIMLIFVTTYYRVSYMDMVVFKRLIRYIATVSSFQRPVFLAGKALELCPDSVLRKN